VRPVVRDLPGKTRSGKTVLKNFGEAAREAIRFVTILGASAALAFGPQAAVAQAPAASPVAEQGAAAAPAATLTGADTAAAAPAASAGSYTPMGPDMIKGQPVPGGLDVQPQYSDIGQTANKLHIGLLWIMGVICVFVLGLLLYVGIRFNRRANPVPSRTSHNTLIEVIWTVVPVLILVAIAVPSISLLAKQYKSPPADALTVKVTGYQWYWGYTYSDNGGFEVISKMLNEPGVPVVNAGVREVGSEPWDGPAQFEVDNRMVVPVGVPIRIQTVGDDVIHSFAVPALWFKIDAVPGRINERLLVIKEPGIYYGQCSELCGIKHGYMPIAVEALPKEQFEAWVLSKGGTLGKGAEAAPAPAVAAPAAADPAADAAPAA